MEPRLCVCQSWLFVLWGSHAVVELEGNYRHMVRSMSNFKIQNDGGGQATWSTMVSCEEEKILGFFVCLFLGKGEVFVSTCQN